MLMAKTIEEAIKKVKGMSLYAETENYYWIEGEKGLVKVLKPLSENTAKTTLKLGCFPERYIEQIFQKDKIKTKALEEALQTKKGLLLSGKAGIGKTFACIYKIAELLREYKISAPLYITLQDFDVKKEQEEKRLKEYDCILIDDLNPNLNNWEKKFAIETIYHAYNNNKKLFITTNASIKELFSFIGEEPVVSRLIEICDLKEIKETKDLRLSKEVK